MEKQISQGNESGVILEDYNYVRTMGSYKARFQGIPEDYYPLTAWEVIKYSIIVVIFIGIGLGIMIGFLFWILSSGLNQYIIIWSSIFLFFAVIMIILFFLGGKSRIKQEKRLIQLQQEREKALQNKSNIRDSQMMK